MRKTAEKLFSQYQHLAPATLYRLFGQPHNVAQSKSMEYDDLLQYAHEGLWKACVSYDGKRSNFETYAINNIRWAVLDGANRESSIFRFNPNNKPNDEDVYNLIGYDSPIETNSDSNSSLTVSETVASEEDTEKTCLHRIHIKELLKKLDSRENEILIHKAKDLKNKDIAEKLNLSPQAISKILINIRKKMTKMKEEMY